MNYSQDMLPPSAPDQTVIVKAPGILNITPNKTLVEKYLKRLHTSIPDIKLLLVVKNPIDRMVSHIVHEYARNGEYDGQTMPDIDDIIMGRIDHLKGKSDLNRCSLGVTEYSIKIRLHSL